MANPMNTGPYDDPDALAAALRDGKDDAWLALYDRYAQRLWREVARRLGPGHPEVGDVVQEVLLAAARSAKGYDPKRGSPWAWLVGIAKRHVAGRVRTRQRELRLARQWWQRLDGRARLWMSGQQEAPPDVLESSELAVLVRATLDTLPLEQQLLLTGRYLDDRSAKDLAEDLGQSPGTVRVQLHRARNAFRRTFDRLAGSGQTNESETAR
jgi:RNA polymerase sigma-70 factor (ECF subfamily)